MQTPFSKSTAEAGRLVLVVGSSGAGKDSLLQGARAALADAPSVVFAQREITRHAEAGGEDHVAVDEETFRERRAAGDYLLAWEAHGLGYGLPADLGERLAEGATLVANTSRLVIDEARRRFPQVHIVLVCAPPEEVAQRLARRGREDAQGVAARLARADAFEVSGEDVTVICNRNGALDEAVAALVAAIRGRDPSL